MDPAHLTIEDLAPWLSEEFSRSAGAGGQNVNKVNTRAELLFDFQSCPLLTAWQKRRIAQRCGRRLAADGRLRIVAQAARTQLGNRRAAARRLLEVLVATLHVPPPRRETRPTAASRARRLAAKKRRGEIKRQRRSGPAGD